MIEDIEVGDFIQAYQGIKSIMVMIEVERQRSVSKTHT